MKNRSTPQNTISPDDITITIAEEDKSEFVQPKEDGNFLRRCLTDASSLRNVNRGYLYSAWTLNGDESDWKTSNNCSVEFSKSRWPSAVGETNTNSAAISKSQLETEVKDEEFVWAKDVSFTDNDGIHLEKDLKKLSFGETARNELDKSTAKPQMKLSREKRLLKTLSRPQIQQGIDSGRVSSKYDKSQTAKSPPRKALTLTAVDRNKSSSRAIRTSTITKIFSIKKRKDGTVKGNVLFNSCLGQGGVAALLRAAKNNSMRQCKSLIDRGISTEVVDHRGWTSLFIALEHDNFECAELLVELQANVNFRNEKQRRYILHELTCLGNFKAVEFLLSRGAKPNVTDAAGWPLIHHAFMAKRLKCAALLLASGADAADYTNKRIQEFKECVRLSTEGKWRYQWQQKCDIDYETKIDI